MTHNIARIMKNYEEEKVTSLKLRFQHHGDIVRQHEETEDTETA